MLKYHNIPNYYYLLFIRGFSSEFSLHLIVYVFIVFQLMVFYLALCKCFMTSEPFFRQAEHYFPLCSYHNVQNFKIFIHILFFLKTSTEVSRKKNQKSHNHFVLDDYFFKSKLTKTFDIFRFYYHILF